MSDRISTSVGELVFRRAAMHDLETVRSIMAAATAIPWAIGRDWSWISSETGTEVIKERIEQHEVFVGAIAGTDVVTMCLQWSDPFCWDERGRDDRAGYVHGLAIVPAYAHKGLGRVLLAWARRYIASRGRKLIRLDCVADNPALCGYYERSGFARAGRKIQDGWTAQLFEMATEPSGQQA